MYYKIKAGRVVAGVEVRVVAEDGTVLPNDGTSVGEFEIRGPWVTGSYYKDEDPAKFHDGWLRTGDVGTLDTPGLHDDLGPHEGRHQVRRRVDLLGRARERRDGPPRRLRGGRHRHPRPEVVRAPAGGRRAEARAARPPRPTWSSSWSTACRAGGCPTSGPSSTRCPRRASGKFDKKVMRAAYADGDYRCRARRCPSERAQRGHGRAWPSGSRACSRS